MPMHNTNYTNAGGTAFAIEIDRMPVPANANDWGYSFLVRELPNGPQLRFRGLILKATVPAQGQADLFIVADPLNYVRHDLLDHYAR